MRWAERKAQTTPAVARLLDFEMRGGSLATVKAAVAAGTSVDPAWGAPLLDAQSMASAFIGIADQASVLGRLQPRRARLNQRLVIQSTRPTATWTAEGSPKPVRASAFSTASALAPKKVATIIVITAELAKAARREDLEELQRTMIDALNYGIDSALLDPAFATGASPGAITRVDAGATWITSTGSSAAAIMANLLAMHAALTDPTRPYWIMQSSTALYLASLLGTNGGAVFPGMSMLPRMLLGLPVLESSVMTPSGSPSEKAIALVDADRLVLASDDNVLVDVASSASLEMDDARVGNARPLVSLFAQNMKGILVERFLNWTALPGSVSYLTGISF